ncbi:hypothetical protein EV714DRAFT_287318 [Schizophyllum commune]
MEASSDRTTLSKSDKYFYANGDCYVKADSTVYRVHFYHLRESTHFFDDLLRIRDDDTALIPNSPGSDEQNLLIIEDVLKQDFEALLWFFYESQYIWTYGVAHCQAVWESVLLLAEKFAMPLVTKAACHALAISGTLDDVLKVALANKFGMGMAWAYDSLERIVTREQAIPGEEALLLGYSMTASLSRAREVVLTAREPCASPVCNHTGANLRGSHSGDLFCKVGHKVFRVHSHHLARSSDVFSAMLALPSETTGSRTGTHEENPVILPGVSIQEWESLLRIGERFDMHDVCKVAVYALGERSSVLDDVRKISLFTKYDLDKASLIVQLKNVCRRSDGLSVVEGRDVGLVMSLLIARAREALTKRAFAARRVLEATDEEAEEVVKEVILAAYSS